MQSDMRRELLERAIPPADRSPEIQFSIINRPVFDAVLALLEQANQEHIDANDKIVDVQLKGDQRQASFLLEVAESAGLSAHADDSGRILNLLAYPAPTLVRVHCAFDISHLVGGDNQVRL